MKQEFSVIIPIFFQNSFVIPSNNSCNTIWAIRQNSIFYSYMYMVNFLWCNIEWRVKTTFLLYMRSSFLTSFMFDSKYYVVHTGHRESLDSLSNSVLKVMKNKMGALVCYGISGFVFEKWLNFIKFLTNLDGNYESSICIFVYFNSFIGSFCLELGKENKW